MNIYSLYKKTHNITGLSYLGFTKQDPFAYKGSGTYWQSHIKKHGYDVTTKILFQTTSKDEIKEKGGEVQSFKSWCGGLVAPESDNNLWNYKFTWNPRNVVVAGQGGAGQS